MAHAIVCTHCGNEHEFDGDIPVGRTAKCLACKARFVIEKPRDEVPVLKEIPKVKAVATKKLKIVEVGNFFADTFVAIVLALITLTIAIAGLAALGFVIALAFSTESHSRFATDNAYGATANASEKIAGELSRIRMMIGVFFIFWFVPPAWKFVSKTCDEIYKPRI
jgi:DNA-directed RNA polymerase subunit RPC12/RpoP